MRDDIIRIYVDTIGKYEKNSKNEKEMVIKCYKCMFVGSLLDWLEEGAAYNLAELYEEMCKSVEWGTGSGNHFAEFLRILQHRTWTKHVIIEWLIMVVCHHHRRTLHQSGLRL